jgi:K+-transporting ATPase ATPase C chain
MKSHLRAALVLFGMLTLLTGVVYPLTVTLLAQVLMPFQANGSVLVRDGKAVGSELIGQSFDDPRYFWGRPSATQKDDKDLPYNAASSGGSNRGPTNPDFLKEIDERVKAMRDAHPHQYGSVPVDLVTASASGLDPHISPAAAEYQVKRVATVRGIDVTRVRQLVAAHTEPRTLGVLGEPRLNVLKLNLALDAMNR